MPVRSQQYFCVIDGERLTESLATNVCICTGGLTRLRLWV